MPDRRKLLDGLFGIFESIITVEGHERQLMKEVTAAVEGAGYVLIDPTKR